MKRRVGRAGFKRRVEEKGYPLAIALPTIALPTIALPTIALPTIALPTIALPTMFLGNSNV